MGGGGGGGNGVYNFLWLQFKIVMLKVWVLQGEGCNHSGFNKKMLAPVLGQRLKSLRGMWGTASYQKDMHCKKSPNLLTIFFWFNKGLHGAVNWCSVAVDGANLLALDVC